jgi:hypothetical protein
MSNLTQREKQKTKKKNIALNIDLNRGETLLCTSELLINQKYLCKYAGGLQKYKVSMK